MATMEDVASFIEGEMKKNITSVIANKIRSLLAVDGWDYVVPGKQAYETIEAMQIWKSMVGNRKPWDHKITIKTAYGDWANDAPSRKDYAFDIWSNVHYGYVGRSVGFSMWTLKNGAGYAQWRAGTSPDGYWSRRFKTIGDADFLAAFDDPNDQAAIDLGGKLWEDKGAGFTHQEFLDRLRARASELSTR